MLTMPVMGTTGPQRNFGAIGNNVIALGGINYAMGFPDTPPTGMGPLYSDFAAPYFAASAILAALHHRNQTGEGQFIDLAQFQATASLLGPALLDYSANGTIPERPGNTHPDVAPHGVYPARPEPHNPDRWISLAIDTDEQWKDLYSLMGEPVSLRDPQYDTNQGRIRNRGDIDNEIAKWTSRHETHALAEVLQAAGIPAGAVQDLHDLIVTDNEFASSHFESMPDRAGRVVYTTHRQPVRLNERTAQMKRAPTFGENNYEIYTTLLGYSDAEYAGLVSRGIVR